MLGAEGEDFLLGRDVVAAAALALTGEAAAWSLKKGAIWWLVRDGDDVQVRAVLSPAVL